MMNKFSTLVLTLAMFVGSFVFAAPAMAQERPTGLPVMAGSINGSVQPYGNVAPKDITVVVSLMRADVNTGVYFPDPATSRRFGPCTTTVIRNCVRGWNYSISDDVLPVDPLTPWRELDIRVEAAGFYHHMSETARVWAGYGNQTYVPLVSIYELGVHAQKPFMYWVDAKVLAVGFWAKSDYGAQDFTVDFVFSGSTWTKAEGKWGVLTYNETVGGDWKWVERTFYAPQDGTAYYGGSLCGEVQVRNAMIVYAQTEKVCASLVPPSWLNKKQ